MKRYRIVCREVHLVEYEAFALDISSLIAEPTRWEVVETLSDEKIEIEEITLLTEREIPL